MLFDTFMTNIVHLDNNRNNIAKKSKNNFVTEIEKFPKLLKN
jgi:urate oxidase